MRSRDADGSLTLEISDTGIGLDPEAIDRIFQPFEQALAGSDRRFGGLGLGLAISKAIVDLHGGSIQAESEGPGKGATFRVELPASDNPLGVTEAEAPDARVRAGRAPGRHQRTPCGSYSWKIMSRQ